MESDPKDTNRKRTEEEDIRQRNIDKTSSSNPNPDDKIVNNTGEDIESPNGEADAASG